MGPKKKQAQKTSIKKSKEIRPLPFISKDRNKLKKDSDNRDCFSLNIPPQEVVDTPFTKIQTVSAPILPIREARIKWPLLEIFTAVNNCEVPRVTVWKPFTREHLNNLKKFKEDEAFFYIGCMLPTDYSELNRHFIKYLIYDVFKWTERNELDEKKTSAILGMYFNTHNYFLASRCRNQKETYDFFKESILLHTIDEPPKSAKILDPFQCKAGLLYFCQTYLPVLPLLRAQLLPNYRLRLQTLKKEEIP